jgi:hypothetical protein
VSRVPETVRGTGDLTPEGAQALAGLLAALGLTKTRARQDAQSTIENITPAATRSTDRKAH